MNQAEIEGCSLTPCSRPFVFLTCPFLLTLVESASHISAVSDFFEEWTCCGPDMVRGGLALELRFDR